MITLNIKKDREHVDIRFPCSEKVITDALKKIGVNDEMDTKQTVSEVVKDFINYRDFGKYISDEYNGKFVSGGFVYISSGRRLEDIIDKDMGMSFGGM